MFCRAQIGDLSQNFLSDALELFCSSRQTSN
jgi:hypothetical protein